MIFNSKIPGDHIKAKEYLTWLLKNGKRFEIVEKRKIRTDRQNRYLHLILSYFALQVGETLDYIKQEIFKKEINPDIFKTIRVNPKSGKKRTDWRTTAGLNTKEMSVSIDRFRRWCSQKTGIYIPEANEHQFLDQIQNEVEQNRHWL
ncbi:hypothetical protein [Mangrovibacterium sp.]|uniref:hypothetical protein n=1 Tax=Mangrovibacterium sp. TaxID=1961364 RepID=UPI00356B61FC